MPATKEDLLKHIFHPVPAPSTLPSPTSKDQRLRTIIYNLDKQQQAVRLSIIEAAKQKVEEHETNSKSDSSDDPDRMDISPPPSATPKRGGMSPLFLANLEAEYTDSMGDVSVSSSSSSRRLPTETGQQKDNPPFEIAMASEALEKISLYNQHAFPTRRFYNEELQKVTGDFRRPSDPRAGRAPAPRSRQSSISHPSPSDRVGASPVYATTSPVDGSARGAFSRPSPRENNNDVSRDPRLNRAGSDPRVRPLPLQRAQSRTDASRDPRLLRRD